MSAGCIEQTVILFDGQLQNIQLKPNSGAVNRRDVVATNMAERGLWKRIYDDYKSRQVVFEVKSDRAVTIDDVRQVLSYTTGEYGAFGVIVSRSDSETPSATEKTWLRMMYADHKRLVLLLPESVIARCLSKLRGGRKCDYTADTLGKMMDALVRSYLSIPSASKYRVKKKK